MSSQLLENSQIKLGFWRKTKAYFALTKPRVIELLLIATIPTMILAQRGIPDPWLVLATVFGGALSAGSANSFNCYIDRDIDKIMGRTKSRPLVTGELSAKEAYLFAWGLGVLSVVWLGLVVNPLAALLSLGAILFYVFVYTLLLKRRTPQNIVWGGAAGAMPVLIGWAAVTGEVSATAWVLFLIVFLWTPPHYWPLSLRYKTEYDAAGVPMLPVVRNNKTVGIQIVLYAWALVASTLLLIPVGQMGVLYTATAVLAGIFFVFESHRLNAEAAKGEIKNPMRLFHGSITYLALLFIAIALDPLFFFNLF
ncbi:MAG: protoheme IX farnesyltransferase [Actinobacteria bacterium]|uniref:Protoheme IX farnesyltransferase n=1 Tax=freshwater metagenome TaxID=449393 RepID=A0A6J6CCR7_9ZZZZ|nr:protoheme IX farnesyltransferase [Actinomycetota bacterium]